jgi:hypothetical protein
VRLEYLVDTDWVIHYLNGQSQIVARLDALKESARTSAPAARVRALGGAGHHGVGRRRRSLLTSSLLVSRLWVSDNHGLLSRVEGIKASCGVIRRSEGGGMAEIVLSSIRPRATRTLQKTTTGLRIAP